MYLSDFIIKWAQQGLQLQRADGSMPSGHNGPWKNNDTPVRNTSHWAQIFFRAFELSSKKEFYTASILACDYLISSSARPYKKSFYCRKSQVLEKQQNGLVGQAWAVECLITIGKKINNTKYLNTALEVLSLHEYDFKKHGWKNVYINGEVGSYNTTVNQQIWFGTVSSMITDTSPSLKARVDDFFCNYHENVLIQKDGLIKHVNYEIFENILIGTGKKIKGFLKGTDKKIYELSIGYQSFILYAISKTIRDQKEIEIFFPFYEKALQFISAREKMPLFKKNPFCFSYNVTGFELAFVFDKIGESKQAEWWLREQFKFSFKSQGGNFYINQASDENIMSARLYEVLNLKNDYIIL